MFGGDLPVMHQSRKRKRKMRGRPFTQRDCGCKLEITNSWVCANGRTEGSAAAEEKTVHVMIGLCR